ncbi:hypothetical protein [Chryseobacterium sp. MP_3.2]|uniref:hypothetical protein n=1 Tax=Chryseobacterium sp. MP_3.2 TaxID=3071712 RepID=UPI002E08DF62|nr:hypothetical protein [Chryseobacterium sp. MP_3.2]
MSTQTNLQCSPLKSSIRWNFILLCFLLLSCMSLQAQMYIGEGATVTVQGSTIISADSITIIPNSETKHNFFVKKSETGYQLTSTEKTDDLLDKTLKLASKESEETPVKSKEFLGEDTSKISRAPIPNPKPKINYSDKSSDHFKSKAHQQLFALVGNSLNSGKKAITAVNSREKTAAFIFIQIKEVGNTFYLNNSPLNIYLNSYRSRPPPFTGHI